MRLLYETDTCYHNVNYDNVSIYLVKDVNGSDFRSAIYVNGNEVVSTDIKNFDLLKKLYGKVANKNPDEYKWINLNEMWKNILKEEEKERQKEEERDRMVSLYGYGYEYKD